MPFDPLDYDPWPPQPPRPPVSRRGEAVLIYLALGIALVALLLPISADSLVDTVRFLMR